MALIGEKITLKITIQEIKTITYGSQGEVLTEERHYTDQEVNESHNWMRDSEKMNYMKKLYGVKDIIAEKEIKTEIYTQTVDAENFTLKKVIGAINDLKS